MKEFTLILNEEGFLEQQVIVSQSLLIFVWKRLLAKIPVEILIIIHTISQY